MDLAAYLRRFWRKVPDEREKLEEVLAAYEGERPMTEAGTEAFGTIDSLSGKNFCGWCMNPTTAGESAFLLPWRSVWRMRRRKKVKWAIFHKPWKGFFENCWKKGCKARGFSRKCI